MQNPVPGKPGAAGALASPSAPKVLSTKIPIKANILFNMYCIITQKLKLIGLLLVSY
jgi:hypothetical protein